MKKMTTNHYFRNAMVIAALLLLTHGAFAQVITTIAGTGTGGFSGDGGPATAANIDGATVVTFDAAGNLYFPDYSNSRIRKIDASGIITTVVGNGTYGYSGDGGPASAACLSYPSFVTIVNREMFIADYYNHVIRKVDTSGIITTIAGNGSGGFSGDGGQATAASLYYPTSVGFDNNSNMFIVDEANDRVRKVTPLGVITTFAGGGSMSGGGIPAINCAMNRPGGIAVDTSGRVYVADVDNARICRIDLSGILIEYAGTATAGYGGDGGPATAAQFNHPLRLSIERNGTLYVGDQRNNRARKIDPTGIVTTIAGTGTAGFSGDGGPATAADFDGPQGVCTDAGGNLYIVDASNRRIRKVVACTNVDATISGGTSVCVHYSITLTAATAGGTWSSSNTAIASVSPTGVLTGVSLGSVTIQYIVTNSCSSDTATYHVTVLNEQGCPTIVTTVAATTSSIAVYPSPNNGIFSLNITSPVTEKFAVTITNVLGQTAGTLDVQSNEKKDIQLSLPAGVYLLSATIHGERVTTRFVVE